MTLQHLAPRALRAACAGLLALLLAACGSTARSPAAGTLLPNENLLAQGIPPIPMALVNQVERYTDLRGHAFVDWHPQRDEMLVAHRRAGASTAQLFHVAGALAAPEPLTDFADPVTEASYEPREGRYLVLSRATGGDEADQLYRFDLDTRRATLLTDPNERHDAIGWLHGRSELLVASVPLDRSAAGGRRAAPGTTLWQVDPLRPESRRVIAQLPGTGWFGGDVSRDDTQLAITLYRSASESQVWRIDLASGERRLLLPAPGETLRATHFPAGWTRDGRALHVLSDRAGEFRELMKLDVASGALQRLSAHIPWDVKSVAASDDGATLALRVNVDGRDELRLIDTATLKERAAPELPGSLNSLAFHRRSHRLAVAYDSARGPNQIAVLDAGGPGALRPWTRPALPAGLDTANFAEQRRVRWRSFDGIELSAIVSEPPARFAGKRPVVVLVHGGPEAQASFGFLGRWHYLIQELGVVVIEPNVRGSSGYGKSFLALDNGMRREDAVKDLGTLLDWIATQPRLDAARVLVAGGSYGGYMALAASVQFAERIAGAIDIVGISNFVTFLNHTESYRRDLRRAEYGDERDPAMRDFLERISPLNQAHRIRKPLFVVQGRNDPRVPYTEAEQIVARLRGRGVPVWYLLAENEGHGFARKENADYQFYATVRFVEATLLAPAPAADPR